MEGRGWGADNFHPSDRDRSQNEVVILLFFEKGCVNKLYAYPLSEANRIAWTRKPVGQNLTCIRIFDPRVLSDRYRFGSVSEFKDELSSRFTHTT